MAQSVAVVRNTLSATASGTTDFTKSGFGTPAAAIIFVCQANTTNNPQDTAEVSIGFWDGTNQSCCMLQDLDNQANSLALRTSDDSYGAIVADSSSRSLYSVSAITDGIRLTLDTDNTTLERYCTVLLIGGVSAKVTNVTAAASSGGTVTSSSLGFAPKLVFFTGIGGTAVDTSTSTGLLSFGVAGDQSGIVQRVLGWGMSFAAANESAFQRYSETRCFSRAAVWTAECTALGADDFTLTTRDGASSSGIIFALALGGADLSFDLGTLTSPTSAGNDVNSTDITPAAVLLNLGTAIGTSEYTDSNANGFMIGLADANGQYSHSAFVEDNAATMNTGSVASASAIVDLDTSSGGARADMLDATVTLNASDFTLTYSAVDATARKGWWVAFGAAGGTTASGAASSAGTGVAVGVGAALSAANADSAGSSAGVLAGASIAAAALSSAGAATATLVGAEITAGVESGDLSAAGTGTATAVGASIAAAAASSTGASTATLEGAATGGFETGDLSSAGTSTATVAGATIAAAAMSSAGSSTATAVGADGSAAAAATRYDGRLPRAVQERRRRQQDDEDVIALVAMIDQEWREAA